MLLQPVVRQGMCMITMEVISQPNLIRSAQYLSTSFEAKTNILGKITIYIIQSVSQFMSMHQADIHLSSGQENNEQRIFPTLPA
jgi:hypothetical protein